MARTARLVIPGQPHHIIQRGNNRQTIFRDEEDFRRFLDWLREAARMFKVAVHAYVLMENHIHLLTTPADAVGLARMMQWLGRQYVPYFNRKYERTGTLWEGRFRTSVVEAQTYFLPCCLYIELNPIRSGLAADAFSYQWSSYGHHAGIRPDPIIVDHAMYWGLGNTPFAREAAYLNMLAQGLAPDAIDSMNRCLLNGRPLGSEQFLAELEKKAGRRVRPGRRGRPPKLRPQPEPGTDSSEK